MENRRKKRGAPVLEALETRCLLTAGATPGRQWASLGGAPGPAGHVRNVAQPVAPETAGQGVAGVFTARFGAFRSFPRSFNLVGVNRGRFQVTLPTTRGLNRPPARPPVRPAATPVVRPVAPPPVVTPPPPVVSPPPPATPPVNLSATAQQIVDLVNQERQAQGLAPLAVNARLTEAAAIHAGQMVSFNRMEHTLPEAQYPGLVDRINAVGYRYSSAGENIAYGYSNAASVMNGWMNSPGHRANVLSTGFTEIGVAVAYTSQGVAYYAQVFGRPAPG